MQAKTEELLYFLLWTCEKAFRPTWRNLEESFEGWAYGRGLLRQLQRLDKLRRYLEDRGFGYLQNSVWITPDPVKEQPALLAEGPVDVESLLVLEACPAAGESDAQIVAGAWDFASINAHYSRYQEILSRRP